MIKQPRMKKSGLTSVFFVFLLMIANGIQGQTSQPQLDQLKLLQQFNGTWQGNAGKDSIIVVEFERFGTTFIETDYFIIGGKKSVDSKWIYGYSPKEAEFKIFAIYPNGNYLTMIGSFTSEKKWVQKIVEDLNPEKVLYKADFNFDTPESVSVQLFYPDGTKLGKGLALKKKQ